jgi:hypothetical protein
MRQKSFISFFVSSFLRVSLSFFAPSCLRVQNQATEVQP